MHILVIERDFGPLR